MSESSVRGASNGAGVAEAARCALERVCSGRSPDSTSRFYSPNFIDYVNDMKFRGHEGDLRDFVACFNPVPADEWQRTKERVTAA